MQPKIDRSLPFNNKFTPQGARAGYANIRRGQGATDAEIALEIGHTTGGKTLRIAYLSSPQTWRGSRKTSFRAKGEAPWVALDKRESAKRITALSKQRAKRPERKANRPPCYHAASSDRPPLLLSMGELLGVQPPSGSYTFSPESLPPTAERQNEKKPET